jgi:hypothetical protein
MRSQALALIALAALAGCSAPSGDYPDRRFLFAGNLASIDGQASNAGVSIEIWARPGSERPAGYDIHTGCGISGMSDDGQRFTAAETLSPCSQSEVETIARLNELLSGPSELRLEPDTSAEFVTPAGRIRFEKTR